MARVRALIRALPKDTVVVSGGARGVDQVAADEALRCGLATDIVPAAWARFGNMAGILRNTTIVERSDETVAFWDLVSRGTMDTVRKSVVAGHKVTVYGPQGEVVPPSRWEWRNDD